MDVEIFENTKENYKSLIIRHINNRDTIVLRLLRGAKRKKRIVFIHNYPGIKEYQSLGGNEKEDCIVLSETVKETIDMKWIGHVLDGTPVPQQLGYTPFMTADEIRDIYQGILKKIT
jgi:hypothetical protein